eukprot:6202044-Pleurochrysis_carterae.AAC.2
MRWVLSRVSEDVRGPTPFQQRCDVSYPICSCAALSARPSLPKRAKHARRGWAFRAQNACESVGMNPSFLPDELAS